jgi:hypothetical protein
VQLHQTSQMSTPRFTDEHVILLRRIMLARQPTFEFTPDDVATTVRETGLSQGQILKWARNFRERSRTKKLDDVLANLHGNQSVSEFSNSLFVLGLSVVT